MLASTGPALTVTSADVMGAVAGSPAVVRGISYRVAGPPEPDGTGITLLHLERA